jgi:hypothetical protein
MAFISFVSKIAAAGRAPFGILFRIPVLPEGWFTVKLFDNVAVGICEAVAIVLLTVIPAVVAATFAVDNHCVCRKPLFATCNGAGLCEPGNGRE